MEEETLPPVPAETGRQTLAQLLEFLADRHPSAPEGTPPLKSVISRSTFLINGFAARDRSSAVEPGDTVDILPPFAGG